VIFTVQVHTIFIQEHHPDEKNDTDYPMLSDRMRQSKRDFTYAERERFFARLSSSCKCSVKRSYDPRPSSQRPDLSEDYDYLIILTDIKNPSFDDTVNLGVLAKKNSF
jgi:hypothetical protein